MTARPKSTLTAAVVLAALGYFVDIYDLVLFSVLRVPSLKALGVPDAELISRGGLLLDLQMGGMLLGGLLWGVLGDKRGRLTVLFGSILLYSAANFANAFAPDLTFYGACRLLAGIGLAGELGAGITLVSELLPVDKRGLGTTLVATVGVTGALVAGALGETFVSGSVNGWRWAYAIGGGMGLLLLALRLGVFESGLFEGLQRHEVSRGDVRQLFLPPARGLRFLRVVLVGTPIWFAIGVLTTFSPELGAAVGLDPKPTGASAVFWTYLGLTVGDLGTGLLSFKLKSRKKVLGGAMGLLLVSMVLLLSFGGRSLTAWYALLVLVGVAAGYWVLFVTTAAEQFGTNLRATVTTSAPNFVRGMVIPITTAWVALKPGFGTVQATLVLGVVCIATGLVALWGMPESYSTELDFLEK